MMIRIVQGYVANMFFGGFTEYVTNMKKLLWSSTIFWRLGHPRPNVGGLETVSKAHDVLLTQPFQSSFVPGKGTPWNPQPYCVLRWFQFLPISISHWQNKQQHTTCILNPRRTMHTIHDRLVTDGSKLGARWCWSIHEQLYTPQKHGSIMSEKSRHETKTTQNHVF